MNLSLSSAALISVMLGSIRTIAFLFVAPPFSSKVIPTRVRTGLGLALTLPMATQLSSTATLDDLPGLLSRAVMQAFIGTALGFACYLIFAAIQAAGDLIDLFGGFTLSAAYDPLSMTQNSVFGRLHNLMAITLLFVSGGHLLVVKGYLGTFRALPLDSGVDLSGFSRLLTHGLSQLLVSALQIAGPLIAVLFLADVGLGLLTRVSTQLNAFSLGFSLKILVTLLLFGVTVPLLPKVVEGTVSAIGTALATVSGG